MKIILLCCFVLLMNITYAQDTTAAHHDSIAATIIGGQDAWRHFLEKNLHPQVPSDRGAPNGQYIVTVSFLVDTSGNVTDVEVLNDPGYGMGDDVRRAFKHCPKWAPATLKGRPVVYRQKQNITYQVWRQ